MRYDPERHHCGALLYGVPSIAAYLGVTDRTTRHLIETGRLPHFKLGATVVCRRATIDAWIAEMERGGGHGDDGATRSPVATEAVRPRGRMGARR